MGLNIFMGSTIQPCGLKLPVPGPARPPPPRPALEVPPALLGPGAAQASTSFPRSRDPRFPPLPPPGSPSSVPKSRIAFLSTAPPGAMTLSLRFSPGRRGQADGVVGQADTSSLPPRTSGPTLAFSASPARSRRRGRVLASCRPPLVTERRAPPDRPVTARDTLYLPDRSFPGRPASLPFPFDAEILTNSLNSHKYLHLHRRFRWSCGDDLRGDPELGTSELRPGRRAPRPHVPPRASREPQDRRVQNKLKVRTPPESVLVGDA